jgi:RecG-like helicase
LQGVGPELARKLAALGIETPRDLAATYPRDYRDWRAPAPIAEIKLRAMERAGAAGEPESSEEIALGRVERVNEFRGRVPVVSADLRDASGVLKATWFGRRGFAGKLAPGDRVFVHGRAQLKRSRGAVGVELNVLHHRILGEAEVYRGAIVPVYRAGKELSSRAIATLIEKNASALEALLPDALPDEIRDSKRGANCTVPQRPSRPRRRANAWSSKSSSASRWRPRSNARGATPTAAPSPCWRRRGCSTNFRRNCPSR